MSAFEVNNIIGDAYPITALPEHYVESTQFKNWRDLFPDETEFHIPDHLYVEDFIVRSQEDLDKIIRADCGYGFTPKVHMEILRNTERYWLEDPNSSPFQLPKKDVSWFSNQLIMLFTEKESTIVMQCMKYNYVELFDYIVERDGNVALNGRSVLNVFSLLYYAVCNNNKEILKRGIDLGCLLSDDLFKPAIEKQNFEIMHMLFEHDIPITKRMEKEFCELASPEMFELFLGVYIGKCKKAPIDLLRRAFYKFDNCEKLLTYIDVSTVNADFIFELLSVFVRENINIRIVMLIETYFGVTMVDFRLENQKEYKYMMSNFIHRNIVIEDNLELYLHLHSSGFWVSEELFESAKYYLCKKITPGLIRRHLNAL